jgi:hypothetical protein
VCDGKQTPFFAQALARVCGFPSRALMRAQKNVIDIDKKKYADEGGLWAENVTEI